MADPNGRRKTAPLPSQQELQALLRYEPETGKLFWHERPREMFRSNNAWSAWNGRYAGSEAFRTPNGRRYLVGSINDTMYRAHRIIWRLVTGEEPDEIDHINGDRADNRWSNLRSVTGSENNRNTQIRANNKSGVMGVCWHKQSQKWAAKIRIDGRGMHLGTFPTIEEATAARKAAERRFGFHANHGRERDLSALEVPSDGPGERR